MSEGLEEMWNRLSLTEKEQLDVIVERDWMEDISEVGKNNLVCKLLLCKMVNVEAMKNVFRKIWRMSACLYIRKVGEHSFIFHFENLMDKERIIQKQPWSFNKSLLILKEFDGLSKPDEVKMEWCSFWVQIHGLPLGMMNEKSMSCSWGSNRRC